MMLMLESAQPSDRKAEEDERKEMLKHKKISSAISQECSNYWRIVDTNHLFSKQSFVAERLTAFKKLMQSTEAGSEYRLTNEVTNQIKRFLPY